MKGSGTMRQEKTIGVDMGGTNIRAARVGQQGIEERRCIPCPATGSKDEVLDCLTDLIQPLMDPDVVAIGAGIPSVIDTEQGIVYQAANIPSWDEVPLKEILTGKFGVRVDLDNDSNCFTLGLARYGEGRSFRHFVGITLGTGLGAGIVINGQLYHGFNGGAGEVGSLPYRDSDFEHYCSSHYFLEQCGEDASSLARKAEQGNDKAMLRWRQFGTHMGELVKALMYAYDPEAVVMGGGIAKAFPLFKATMMATAQTFPYPKSVGHLHVIATKLADAALLGAASLNHKYEEGIV